MPVVHPADLHQKDPVDLVAHCHQSLSDYPIQDLIVQNWVVRSGALVQKDQFQIQNCYHWHLALMRAAS